jgi:hypothetical protein
VVVVLKGFTGRRRRESERETGDLAIGRILRYGVLGVVRLP